jgi:hypothetical protein
MSCALLTMVNMIYDQHWQYILLPIGILLWGSYVFFKDNDREYLKSRGINPDDYETSFTDFLYGGYNSYDNYNGYGRTTYNPPKRNGNTITWDNSRVEDNFDSNLFGSDHTRYQPKQPYVRNYQDPRYKGMVEKCKRNFKITVEENDKKDETNQKRTTLFFSSHRNGARSDKD